MAILIRKTANSESTVRTGRGGRKEKSAEKQLNQTVKTTLTKADLEGLQQHFRQHTVGQKISFAEYVRQLLLTRTDRKSGSEERSSLLAIQLELAEIENRLSLIVGDTARQNTAILIKEMSASMSANELKEGQEKLLLRQNLDRLEATIKQISQWLYDCSPEKI